MAGRCPATFIGAPVRIWSASSSVDHRL